MSATAARNSAFAFAVICFTFLALSWRKDTSTAGPKMLSMSRFTYEPGYFQHDKQPTGPEQGFRATTLPSFGIIDRNEAKPHNEAGLAPWQQLDQDLTKINAVPDGPRYKVFFVARHGEGVHNVKERQVGRQEWETYWSRKDGDGNMTWVDPELTSKGLKQAEEMQVAWREQQETHGALPERYYSSPLRRCLQTARGTFSHLISPGENQFKPLVKEGVREIYGVHTCDKRSTRTWIEANFPEFSLEADFTENDELWTPDRRETFEEKTESMRNFLLEVFNGEGRDATYISLTTHSWAIRALYVAIGHPDVWVAAGATVPIVICGS